MDPINDKYVSIMEVAKYLGVSIRYVHSLLKKGEIKKLKIGHEWKIEKSSLGGLMDEILSDSRKIAIEQMAKRFLLQLGRDKRIKI